MFARQGSKNVLYYWNRKWEEAECVATFFTLWCIHIYSTAFSSWDWQLGGGAMVETALLVIIKLLFFGLVGVTIINFALVFIVFNVIKVVFTGLSCLFLGKKIVCALFTVTHTQNKWHLPNSRQFVYCKYIIAHFLLDVN